MRIGFFTDSYLPAVHGVEVSVEAFRRSLQRAGHGVFVYAPAVPHYRDTNRNAFRLKSVRVGSLTDTQGIVILEALASGLGVVALRDTAFTNMVIDGENGLLTTPNSTLSDR